MGKSVNGVNGLIGKTKMTKNVNQNGVSLIAAVFIIVVLAFMGVMFVSLINTGSLTSVNDMQSSQALYIAEGGVENSQYALAQNLDWYRSASDPMPAPTSTTLNLGAGSFTASVNLPATMLTKKLTNGGGAANVYTTQRFPSAGYLQIDNIEGSPEFVRYTGTTATSFTGLTHNQTIGTAPSSEPVNGNGRDTVVYPVTTLISPLTSTSCGAIPNPFQITYHQKFLSAGTIMITSGCQLDLCASNQSEQITYTGASTSGGTMTLSGVTRCRNGTSGITAVNGDPVTSLQESLMANIYDYEVEIISTGNVSNAQRSLKKTMQR